MAVLAAVACIYLLSLLVLPNLGSPNFRGKSLSGWHSMLTSKEEPEYSMCAAELQSGGLDALPTILALARADKSLTPDLADLVAKMDESVIPKLIESAGDESAAVRKLSAMALGRMGPRAHAATSPLLNCLRDKENYVREEAARALGMIQPEGEEVCEALMKSLRDSD